jgi:predicted alpha/beta superfamily hydrolase
MALRLDLYTATDDDRPVYVAGNFSGWLPDLDPFRMQMVGPGQYSLDLPDETWSDDNPLIYKYTRGGWDTVELDEAGQSVPDRVLWRSEGYRHDLVPTWRWLNAPAEPENLLPVQQLISDEFYSPELGTSRRVRILLPYDYARTGKRYPVLYLHDGQNLLGDGSGYGTWAVDWQLAQLATRRGHELIVVAIDHAGDDRIPEMIPEQTRIGAGRGMDYLRFIVETLKPHIDQTYRTRPGAGDTGLGGSSLGGLISLYGGLRFAAVFGRWLVFSPSLWVTGEVYAEAKRLVLSHPVRVYLYGGELESRHMLPALDRLKTALLSSPNHDLLDIRLVTNPNGRHTESDWAEQFPQAVSWLFRPNYTYRHRTQLAGSGELVTM